MITASVQKSGKSLSPCSLHPCGLNDKSLPEHHMTDKFLVETAIYRRLSNRQNKFDRLLDRSI
ncbi:hypothetical protein [Nostoc sp.]|uniref:hypothetical protein n=1 Tax=Nostoc sp. TaxID=1180 RepID=UPI002FEE70F1